MIFLAQREKRIFQSEISSLRVQGERGGGGGIERGGRAGGGGGVLRQRRSPVEKKHPLENGLFLVRGEYIYVKFEVTSWIYGRGGGRGGR